MSTASPLWAIRLIAPDAALVPLLNALEEQVDSVSWFEAGVGQWRIEAICAREPDRPAVVSAVTQASADAGVTPLPVAIEALPATDWLTENRKSFAPVSAGRYFIHGSDHAGAVPVGAVALQLDAGLAFGSGAHETTRGCLLALDGIAKIGKRPRRILDMGCGSGILALAAARTWRAPVLAVDVDPIAVAVARENARRNGLAGLVGATVGNGWRQAAVRRAGSFDLVTANILAAPLRDMARDFAKGLAPGGNAVLSGLLVEQEAGVLGAYRLQGLALTRRIRLAAWSTLVLHKENRRLQP